MSLEKSLQEQAQSIREEASEIRRASPIQENIGIRLYTKNSIVVATFFGGPLATAYLLSQNFRKLGNDSAAKNSLLIGVGYTAAFMVAARGLIPELANPGFFLLIGLIHMMVADYLVRSYQEFQIKMHLDEGGQKAPIWKTLLVVFTTMLLGLLVSILVEITKALLA